MCCYQSLPDRPDDSSSCQFDKDTKRLTSVGGYTFCPFHLPYSEADLIEKYGPSNGDNPRGYKEFWSEAEARAFHQNVSARIVNPQKSHQSKRDLAGTVFPKTFRLSREQHPATSFEDCHFAQGVDFHKAKFADNVAQFKNAKFSGSNANFFDLRVDGGSLHFEGAQFIRVDANFGTSGILKGADTNTYAIRVADFEGATFSGKAKFINRRFCNRTNFKNVTFEKAPLFHGSELHQDTTFPPIENFKDTKSNGAAHAYRTLRLAMKQQEAHEEEAMFWALEQRSKRNNLDLKQPKNWLPWSLSWAYDLLSNYGLNAGLPARWLGGWIIYSAVIYACVAGSLEKLTRLDHWLGAFGFSIAQMARPFFIWGDYDGADIKAALGSDVFSFLIKMLATVDSIVSLTLIALFILAVRRRFRMQ